MKRLITTWAVLSAVLVAVIGAPTDAQAIGAYLSYWNAKDYDNGYGLGVKHKFQIIPIVSAEGRVSWISFDDEGHSVNMFPLEADVRAKLGLLYGAAGVGWYAFTGDDPNPDHSFGGFILGGGEFTVLGLGAFAELKYTWVEPDVSGIKTDASGIGVNAGVLLGVF